MVTSREPSAPEDAQAGSFPSGPPATPRDTPFLADPTVDRLVRAVVTLTMELSVTRDRLRAIELLLARDGRDISEEIDQLALTPAEDNQRRSDRDRLIASVVRPLIGQIE
jgi:hypothetical protein